MQTLAPGADAALAALLAQAWRATPAATAVKWSRGEWQRQPHLTLISDALAAMAEGPIRLIVSMPPRHGKSIEVSCWLPIWFLVNWPTGRIGLASYAADFASDWGLRVRRIIEQTPELGIRVSKDRARAHDWQIEEGGSMMTAGVGGPFTGRGFDLLIIDDPIKNRSEANSATYRKHLWDWWTSTARTRLEPGGSIVIVATRWHEDDLIGRLLNGPQGDDEFGVSDVDLDEWQYIRLPALAEDDDPLAARKANPCGRHGTTPAPWPRCAWSWGRRIGPDCSSSGLRNTAGACSSCTGGGMPIRCRNRRGTSFSSGIRRSRWGRKTTTPLVRRCIRAKPITRSKRCGGIGWSFRR